MGDNNRYIPDWAIPIKPNIIQVKHLGKHSIISLTNYEQKNRKGIPHCPWKAAR